MLRAVANAALMRRGPGLPLHGYSVACVDACLLMYKCMHAKALTNPGACKWCAFSLLHEITDGTTSAAALQNRGRVIIIIISMCAMLQCSLFLRLLGSLRQLCFCLRPNRLRQILLKLYSAHNAHSTNSARSPSTNNAVTAACSSKIARHTARTAHTATPADVTDA